MNNTNSYKVSFSILGNFDCQKAVTFSTSVKKALAKAEGLAWDLFYKSPNTNWADCWITIYNPKGKLIWSGFEGDLSRA